MARFKHQIKSRTKDHRDELQEKRSASRDRDEVRVKVNINVTHQTINKKLSCPDPNCNYESSKKSKINRHVNWFHRPSTDILCPFEGCDFAAPLQFTVNMHIKMRHEEPKYVCHFPNCDNRFALKHELRMHLHTAHLTESRYECFHIGCRFTTDEEKELALHLASQHDKCESKKEKFRCVAKRCTFESTTSIALRIHVRAVHGIGRHSDMECPLNNCHDQLASAREMKSHLDLKHGINLPFLCPHDTCRFSTFAQFELDEHINTEHH